MKITMNLPTEHVIKVLENHLQFLQKGIDGLHEMLKTMEGKDHEAHSDIRRQKLNKFYEVEAVLNALRAENPENVTVDAKEWGQMVD